MAASSKPAPDFLAVTMSVRLAAMTGWCLFGTGVLVGLAF